MLSVPDPSPPVPTMSIAPSGAATRSILRAHRRDRAGDLVDRLAPHPQRHQEAADLRRRRLARHDDVEGLLGLLARERAPVGGLADQRLELRP